MWVPATQCGSSTLSSTVSTLAGAGFERAEPKETGRLGYDPSDLLKLYIYGCLNRVRSSRRLEAETHRNLEVIWLLRRLRPNFKTLADFRRENREAFRQVFRDFVKVCRSLELFGRELIAVDGTRIKAVNSRDRNFTGAKLRRDLAASQERLERYLQQMDEMDAADMADASPSKGRGRDWHRRLRRCESARRVSKRTVRRCRRVARTSSLADRPQGDAQWHWRGGGVQRANRGGHEAQADCRAAGA